MNHTKYCSSCGLCESYPDTLNKVCPRLKKPEEKYQNLLGEYEKIILVKGSRKRGTYSGSIVSTLLAAKESGLIDGALGVRRGETIIKPKPLYANTSKEINSFSGMRHTISSHLSILNEIPYDDRIAVIGLPCHIEAINKIKKTGVLKHNIKYLISIACGTNYAYDKFLGLIQNYGINIEDVKFYTLRDTKRLRPYFVFKLNNGNEIRIPVSKTKGCIPSGCIYCNDYLGYHSDISFGVLGAPEGYSLAYIRNRKGRELIEEVIKKGYLEQRKLTRSIHQKIIEKFLPMLPIDFYLPIAFKLKFEVGAEFMAKYKILHLNKKLEYSIKD